MPTHQVGRVHQHVVEEVVKLLRQVRGLVVVVEDEVAAVFLVEAAVELEQEHVGAVDRRVALLLDLEEVPVGGGRAHEGDALVLAVIDGLLRQGAARAVVVPAADTTIVTVSS